MRIESREHLPTVPPNSPFLETESGRPRRKDFPARVGVLEELPHLVECTGPVWTQLATLSGDGRRHSSLPLPWTRRGAGLDGLIGTGLGNL